MPWNKTTYTKPFTQRSIEIQNLLTKIILIFQNYNLNDHRVKFFSVYTYFKIATKRFHISEWYLNSFHKKVLVSKDVTWIAVFEKGNRTKRPTAKQ